MKPALLFCTLLCSLTAFSAEKNASPVRLEKVQLVGDLTDGKASFLLTGIAHVSSASSASLPILSGTVAVTEFGSHNKWNIRENGGQYIAVFDRKGDFHFQLKFQATVRAIGDKKEVRFQVAPGPLQSIRLRGLSSETQLEFEGAARPERHGDEFTSILGEDGRVRFSWKDAQPQTAGKLFYAAEMLSQISVSPGLLRQAAALNFKVMQGELRSLTILLRGPGEVTRVQGDEVLAWDIEPVSNSNDRRLTIKFNQPQTNQFSLQIQAQATLGAFPQTADVLAFQPESATRFSGFFRVVNDGAVRLEVTRATGLSQVSPETFPETEVTRALLHPTGTQRFVYRFSGPDFALRVQADQILPELTVSEVVSYHFAENELAIDGELELEVREAPLRELSINVPPGYAVARLAAPGLGDYFIGERAGKPELRLIFVQPVTGHQVVQLRLERAQSAIEETWSLPPLEVPQAKSVRGYIASAADPGFRLSPQRTSGLTEIAGAFFPKKQPGIQSAFRLSDSSWQAVVHVDRMPQTVQADAFHLFSIGEGIAYGSSVINYTISGAPLSTFKFELSDEYFNVEFTGKDVRNWQKTAGGYIVQLHSAVSGSYTLLATFERPFKPHGDTLSFTGARPLDAQSEQGHALVISTYQFQVSPVDVSPALLPLEPGEVPAEYRLFFDSPILAAYRYTSRPFNLRLALNPLAQGDSLSLVIDRASLVSKISKEGQVITDIRYFIKNRGNPRLRVVVPTGSKLWSATVDGTSVVPVADGNSNLIPLPTSTGSNATVTLELKVAYASDNARRVRLIAPALEAPIMLAQWRIVPDTGQALGYRGGSLTPAGHTDDSGFAQFARALGQGRRSELVSTLCPAIVLIGLGLAAWWWAAGASVRLAARHIAGLILGTCLLFAAILSLSGFTDLLLRNRAVNPDELTFLVPIQQANTALTVDVSNSPAGFSAARYIGSAWLALFAVALWFGSRLFNHPSLKLAARCSGWVLIAWAAARSPNGAIAFLIVLGAFLVCALAGPLLFQALRLPPKSTRIAPSDAGASAATASVLLLACIAVGLGSSAYGGSRFLSDPGLRGVPESVEQQIRVEDDFAIGTATIRWHAEKGQCLPLLRGAAVLTDLKYSQSDLSLEQTRIGAAGDTPGAGPQFEELRARKSGTYQIQLQYQTSIVRTNGESGFYLPLQPGLINHLTLVLNALDVDVTSSGAVSIDKKPSGSNTVAVLVLSPNPGTWIGWKPKTRDVGLEQPLFYAELAQIYAPAAGVVEGAHLVSVRVTRGELKELDFEIPARLTVTDVMDSGAAGRANTTSSILSLWRFDPDRRHLHVTLARPESKSFSLTIRSQVATSPLPFEQVLGLIKISGAADQLGLAALATANDVQLDSVAADAMEQINLEDFPTAILADFQAQVGGAVLRRAFRYSNPEALLNLKASPVQPDIRVESQDTISLGEDRTVLASTVNVNIARAGIFRLSFPLPQDFDVDSISGPALSHWTLLTTNSDRVVTLHLKGQTEGRQQFSISLAGPGARAATNWTVPQLFLREANKHTGSLLLVPEQGLRLQTTASTGMSQLDPQQAGIKQKGVLAFRVLQPDRRLSLTIERVDAWIQVSSLQHAVIGEAQTRIFANLQYEIENSGLKTFHVLLPTNAESVRFEGDQVSDFLPVTSGKTNDMQSWEVRLNRRVIGSYLLKVTCATPLAQNATSTTLRGIQALGVNLQRGYVTVQTGDRLQVRSDGPPAALQASEWQSIPRSLQQGIPGNGASFTYRLVDPDFTLGLAIERYQAAQLLPARISSVDLQSVISENGVMLTRVTLQIYPGEKRLLRTSLPQGARFWFAFVNQAAVWPWREQDQVLIPLEQQALGDKLVPVEIFFSSSIGESNRRTLDLALVAPKFDLPLENITWRVGLDQKWELRKWSGTLQFQGEDWMPQNESLDLEGYLSNELLERQERAKKAEDYLNAANAALAEGNPLRARRAFQSAFGLSTSDAAFNEDARVQLHNIKLQEALVGLNVRQVAANGENGSIAQKVRQLRERDVPHYTQQDAKDILERNSADENVALMRLAERLIQQQDAASTSATALHATIPNQGRSLTFKRAILVSPWATLKLDLTAGLPAPKDWSFRFGLLGFAILLIFGATWGAQHVLTTRRAPHA